MKPNQTETSPLCRAMLAFVASENFGLYNGNCSAVTPQQLFDLLEKHGGDAARETGFPTNAARLGIALNKEKAALETLGVRLLFQRSHDFGRLWIIGKMETYPTEAALLSDLDERAQRKRIYER